MLECCNFRRGFGPSFYKNPDSVKIDTEYLILKYNHCSAVTLNTKDYLLFVFEDIFQYLWKKKWKKYLSTHLQTARYFVMGYFVFKILDWVAGYTESKMSQCHNFSRPSLYGIMRGFLFIRNKGIRLLFRTSTFVIHKNKTASIQRRVSKQTTDTSRSWVAYENFRHVENLFIQRFLFIHPRFVFIVQARRLIVQIKTTLGWINKKPWMNKFSTWYYR